MVRPDTDQERETRRVLVLIPVYSQSMHTIQGHSAALGLAK